MWLVDLIKEIRRCKSCESLKDSFDRERNLWVSLNKEQQDKLSLLESTLFDRDQLILDLEKRLSIRPVPKNLKPIGGIRSWRDIRSALEEKHRIPINITDDTIDPDTYTKEKESA